MTRESGTAAAVTGAAIVWFRDDLRLADNPAVVAAAERGGAIIALYVHDEESPGIRPLGGATRWWLHQSLRSLGRSLEAIGVPLVLRRGPAAAVIDEVVEATGAGAVFWNRRYGRAERELDADVKSSLRDRGLTAESFAASLLFEPWTISTGSGTPYSVFTPFWNACRDAPPPRAPLERPTGMHGWDGTIGSDDLDDWRLEPSKPDWAEGLRRAWTPGEEAASAAVDEFLADRLPDYADERDIPSSGATSRLSPHLRFGEISPHAVWHRATQRRARAAGSATSIARFLTELGWREFAHHVLFHAPDLATTNWRREFDAFPWPPLHHDALEAWQHGRTGVPLVDAGMRELWETGTMHNRIRMVTASFLTKNLLIDWRHGEEWFWDTLVDADAASNPFNWQWVAGSGADAAPYFRVFNPELQAKKFDAAGDYVSRWVPEVGTSAYPDPIVDLAETRRAALAAYDVVKRAR